MDIDTEVEPPLPDVDSDDDGDGSAHVYLMVSVHEDDGTARNASTCIDADEGDEVLADGLVQAVLGAARMRSPALAAAVQQHMRRQ